MKKFFLMAVVAIFSVSAVQAQIPVKYQGEVDAGYSIGVGSFAASRINLHTIHGIKVGRFFSTGVGLGFDMYHEGGFDLIVPVYLNLKGYLPVSEKVAPFFSIDIGAGIWATEAIQGASGLMVTPAVGVKFGKFKAQLGYNLQQLSSYGESVNVGAVQIRIGAMF